MSICFFVQVQFAAGEAMQYQIRSALLIECFKEFRRCGQGAHECQQVWTSSWERPHEILNVVHPRHRSHSGGFDLDNDWLNDFWRSLSVLKHGIRLQVHTHPFEAFHSPVDDRFPIINSVGFLSLVIPNFGLGPVGFEGAYLAEIQSNGSWLEVPIDSRLEVIA